MKTFGILITALSIIPSLVAAQAAAGGGVLPQAPPPATTVWVTVTDAAGVVATGSTADGCSQKWSDWTGAMGTRRFSSDYRDPTREENGTANDE
ncbi:hypothetical protein AA313_de0204213 [Arthrobotrys entomopaga]|nr:hypothetical protein AA313_de0204213 [Arthrobotrys entomopaga]